MAYTILDTGGYELGVFRRPTGSLVIALPVSVSFVTDLFEFEVSESIANALIADSDLRLRLDKKLHSMLQGRITRGGQAATDEECAFEQVLAQQLASGRNSQQAARQIAQIASQLGCSLRTVERKLWRIRAEWS